ncbi:MAG: hypothetical protein C4554_05280 [Dethiobacter sp.]|nr:MAG: hypothetical protein C4554_05280 [Dethiobacter sp.]
MFQLQILQKGQHQEKAAVIGLDALAKPSFKPLFDVAVNQLLASFPGRAAKPILISRGTFPEPPGSFF